MKIRLHCFRFVYSTEIVLNNNEMCRILTAAHKCVDIKIILVFAYVLDFRK